MTFLLVVFVVMVLAGGLLLRRGNEARISLGDIPTVFGKVNAAGKDGTFAAFRFRIADETVKDTAVNVQFSVEDGRAGFDWMLTSEVNRRDRERYLALGRDLGHTVTEHKARNGCEYLRVEDGDLAELCRASIVELYRLQESTELGLVWQGFDWP
jgi:hypothetical protein